MTRPVDKPPSRFGRFKREAEAIVESPQHVQKLVGQAVQKLQTTGVDRFREMREQLELAIAMVRAWMSGDYDGVSRKTAIILIAALLYFVVPFDVVPDFLFSWGFIDDAAVLAYVFNQLREEIEAFRKFNDGEER